MPSSRSNKKTTENPGRETRSQRALTREGSIAKSANEFAKKGSRPEFGAPVSASQIAYYEQALKQLRKSKTLAQFLGFKSADAGKRALKPVAQGDKSASALDSKYKDATKALSLKLDALHAKDGKVNKTWPRKHAIVLHALLSEKPAPAKRTPKPKPAESAPAPAPSTTPEPVNA